MNMFRFCGLLVLCFSAALGLSPLESDSIVCDGEVSAVDGRAELSVPLVRHEAGWYANIEGPDSVTIFLNGEPVAGFGKEKLPKSRIGALDLSEFASRLRPGANRVELEVLPAGRLWLRMWTSDNAWYPANFHAHTTYSDGAYSVHDLLQRAISAGAQAYAITDHNSLASTVDTAFHPVGSLQPIRGTEWTSELGHACVLGLEGSSVIDSACALRSMLDEASYRGAFVQINHPCDDELGFGWDRYPVLDSSIDWIEIFNNLTYFPPSPRLSDREAIAWWHSLLVSGKTIAATGNSDYHGNIPGEGGPMESQTLVFAPSNHPDSILKYTKLGQGMIMDESNDGRIYVYADTNNNGSWDLVMGQHARITTTRTVRFRAEIQDADFLDEFWVYTRSGTVHNYWFTNPFGPWDHAYEWTANYGASSRDFVRAYHENGINDPELATNAIYINHPDYELGPTDLLSQTVNRPDTMTLPAPETLRFRLTNVAGFSPWRYGLAVAFDTADFDVLGWQTAGTGVGEAENHASGAYEVLEWRGGFTWSNRLPVDTSFDFWLVVQPKQAGPQPLLFRSWAHDRIQLVETEPTAGFFGPENAWWHCESIFVKMLDVQPVSIDLPVSSMDSSGPLTPLATVRNNGNSTVSFGATMTIGSYSGTASVTGLGPGAIRQVSFVPDWQPVRGSHAVRCVTTLAGDRVPGNDTLSATTSVLVRDVGAVAVKAPLGVIGAGPVTPRASFRNFGTEQDTVRVYFVINSTPAFAESLVLTDGLPFYETTIDFPSWNAVAGSYTARCSVAMRGDQIRNNDAAGASFTVTSSPPPQPGWHAKAPLPGTAGAGAWLAYSRARRVVYAAKGNKQSSFYYWDPAQDSWFALSSIPLGTEAKPPGKGAAGCADPYDSIRFVYALKGNNTQGFWRYNPDSDSWQQMALLPLGRTNKKVKGGSDLAWVTKQDGSRHVYCLKGYKNEFWRYDVAADSWRTMPDVPSGASNQLKCGAGSWIVADGDRSIYCHKAKYHDMLVYDVELDSWVGEHKGMPFISQSTGKSKKSKDGGSAVHAYGFIYALKGGNTCDFYRYSIAGDSWVEMPPMPEFGGSLKKKKVKAGADITAMTTEFPVRPDWVDLPALKGNKTNEFWMFTDLFGSGVQGSGNREGVMAGGRSSVGSWQFTVMPNPMRADFATVHLDPRTLGPSNPVLSIFDPAGRLVLHSAICNLRSETALDLRGLSAGVYLVRLSAGSFTTAQKLVIQR